MSFDLNIERLLQQRYYQPGERWEDLVERVVEHVCVDDNAKFSREIRELLLDRVFLPNSPCLVNAGTKNNGLVACFTVGPEEDTLENHFEVLGDIAAVGKFGGGCGFTGSFIGPKGALVGGSAHDQGKGIAYGPIAWAMRVSESLDMITQGGFRKMALMFALSGDHEDIEEFIDLKQSGNENLGYNFNQSIMVTHDWMDTAINEFGSREGELLRKAAYNAWNNGEPGLLFEDTINNVTPYRLCGCKIHTTNPCGEQPLPSYLACVLASINVNHDLFWDGDNWLFYEFSRVVELVTRFLDNVGTVTTFPNEKFQDAYDKHRPIGVGIMGLADAFLRAGIRYGSEESLQFTSGIFNNLKRSTYLASEKLGMERGVPEHCKPVNRRNITTMTVAPTGSIAFIAGCSHGIEPIFSKSYIRTDERGETYTFQHPQADDPNFVEAGDLTWEEHLDIQKVAQIYVDAGVSKTINLPNDATVEDVYDAYVYAWETGCKGITVYRDGSRQKEVITTGNVDRTHEKRPSKLEADVYHIKPNGEDFEVAVGLLDGTPYEVFVFRYSRHLNGRGSIVKNSPGNYDLLFETGETVKNIGARAYSEEQLLARLISLALRSGVDIRFIVEQISKASGTVTSYSASVNRALKNYVDGSVGIRCGNCGSKSVQIIEGCESCSNCGDSKCS